MTFILRLRYSIMVISISVSSVLFLLNLTFPCALVLGFPIEFPYNAITEISSFSEDISELVIDQEIVEASDVVIHKESGEDKNLKSSTQLCSDPGTIYYETIEPDIEGGRRSI